jgi:3-dehydroquinate dehydratase II
LTGIPVVTVINGPNLGLLGSREPESYGTATQDDLRRLLDSHAGLRGARVEFFQSDIEGEIVKAIGTASGGSMGLVINPAGYSHTSVAILDAMKAFPGPVVEVHITQVLAREPFRRRLLTAGSADAFLAGAGVGSYLHAIDIVLELASIEAASNPG